MTKFFNNQGDNSLFNKLSDIAQEMTSLNSFLAVVGFFRSSGYFKLREKLGDISEIKILVGINVDSFFKEGDKKYLGLPTIGKTPRRNIPKSLSRT